MIIFFSGVHRPAEFAMTDRLPDPPSLMPTFYDVYPENKLSKSGRTMVLDAMRVAHGIRRLHGGKRSKTRRVTRRGALGTSIDSHS